MDVTIKWQMSLQSSKYAGLTGPKMLIIGGQEKVKILLVPYWNFHVIGFLNLHGSRTKEQQQRNRNISVTSTTALFLHPCHFCQFFSFNTHSISILATFIYLTHLLICFAMSRIAKTSLIKRRRFCVH